MSYVFSTSVDITTSTAGAATVYTGVLNGMISVIKFTPTDTASTADLVVTTEDTSLPVTTIANLSDAAATVLYPRAIANTVASGGVSGGSVNLIPVAHERLKFALTSGGNAKTAEVTVFIQ